MFGIFPYMFALMSWSYIVNIVNIWEYFMKYMNKLKQDLIALAAVQEGYFTSAQAKKIGYNQSNFSYNVKSNNWKKVSRALFRLYDFNDSFKANCVKWALWSHNRNGQAQAIISHDSALYFYKLIDEEPEKTHLTVPKDFQKRNIPKEHIVIHKDNLPLSALENHGAFMTTNLFRTLKDTKKGLEKNGDWKKVAEKTANSQDITQEQLLQLGIISNSQPLNTVTNYNAEAGSIIETSVKDEVYYRAQDSQKIFESIEKQGRWAMSASICRGNKSQQRGFTLVELLVVIAVISILAGMLLPVLENAVDSAKQIACINNLKQIGIATCLYTDDSDGQLPNTHESKYYYWKYQISTYLGMDGILADPEYWKGVFLCPSWPDDFGGSKGYGWNNAYMGIAPTTPPVFMKEIEVPSKTILCGDTTNWSTAGFSHIYLYPPSWGAHYPGDVISDRHDGGLNLLWADFTARRMLTEELMLGVGSDVNWYYRADKP
jgi:prepilin-type N-terminal cleavage/methylation domain-containing protein/prepilin-type processing-associated H-X9-DG protein